MKIVCGSCQAKYSIADEKVAGKVFRIRCKRCDEVIVVRGDQDNPQASASGSQAGADTPQAPAEAQAPSDAIWHVVINGEQAGPYSPAQLGELVASGQLDWEAYVWAEGFENWLPMRDVPDLVSAISGEPAVAVSMGKPAATVANTQMGADPFPEEAQQAPQVAVFAKAAGAAVGGVVQTNVRAEPGPSALASYDNPGPTTSGGGGPRVSAQQAMTGARNENSVLFSLKNLQALATGSVPPGNGPNSVRPGHASGEGSGLIDIRALASTTGVAEPTRNSEKDALLALGSAQGGAFGALGSPMLAPAGKADDESGKKPLILAVIGGFALLAISGVAIAFILKGNGPTPAEVAPIAPSAAPPAAAATATAANGAPSAQPTAAAATPSEPPSEGELAARAAAAAAAKENEASARPAEDGKPSGTHSGPAAGKRPSGTVEKAAEPAAVAAKPEPTPAKPADKPKSNGNSSIDDLLNDAIGGKGNAVGAKSSAPANLPEKPSRDDVLNAMKGVTDAVKACSGGQPGVAFANVTVVGKTGMVANVDVTGVTGDVAPCIGKAVRKARFPKFSAENFQVKFPFRL